MLDTLLRLLKRRFRGLLGPKSTFFWGTRSNGYPIVHIRRTPGGPFHPYIPTIGAAHVGYLRAASAWLWGRKRKNEHFSVEKTRPGSAKEMRRTFAGVILGLLGSGLCLYITMFPNRSPPPRGQDRALVLYTHGLLRIPAVVLYWGPVGYLRKVRRIFLPTPVDAAGLFWSRYP